MIKRKTIEEVFTNVIESKCHDYPKAVALRNYDASTYTVESYAPGQDYTDTDNSPVGELQQKQEELQSNVDYTYEDKCVLNYYGNSSFGLINDYLWDNLYLNNLIFDINGNPIKKDLFLYAGDEVIHKSIPEQVKILSNIIDKSPRLQKDSILYRAGHWSPGMKPGEHGTLKGFSSTSFNQEVSKEWKTFKEDKYLMRIYAPKGTRGVVLTEDNSLADWQSEFLLDKNQKYIVLSQDDANKTVDILLY